PGGSAVPLVTQDRDGRSCPGVVCDHCGEEIADARDGNYQWRTGGHDTDWGSRVYFTHKRCCPPFEQARPADDFLWGPWSWRACRSASATTWVSTGRPRTRRRPGWATSGSGTPRKRQARTLPGDRRPSHLTPGSPASHRPAATLPG